MQPDITRHYHGNEPASVAANAKASPRRRQSMRDKILHRIAAAGAHGMTCDEVEVAGGFSHQSCSARMSELKRDGQIKPSGTMRATRWGADGRVFVNRDVTTPTMLFDTRGTR